MIAIRIKIVMIFKKRFIQLNHFNRFIKALRLMSIDLLNFKSVFAVF